MFDTIFGLPVHPLVVHATVVVVPVAAVLVGLAALWPRFRSRAGVIPFAVSLLALALVPLTVQSGKSLKDRVEPTALVERHGDLGDGLLPWVVVLTVAAAALLWLRRRESATPEPGRRATGRWLLAAAVVVALVGVVGSSVQIIRIGHSGAEAAWTETIEN